MPLLSPGLFARARTVPDATARAPLPRPVVQARRCSPAALLQALPVHSFLVWLLPAHVATGFVRQAPNWWHPTAARFAAAAMPVAVAPAAVTLPRSALPAQRTAGAFPAPAVACADGRPARAAASFQRPSGDPVQTAALCGQSAASDNKAERQPAARCAQVHASAVQWSPCPRQWPTETVAASPRGAAG